MRRLPRLAAVTAMAATALTVAPLSATLGGTASAATASISATGTWVYPYKLTVVVHGTPAQPYTADSSGSTTHTAQWFVYKLDPSQACPATPDDAPGAAEVGEGDATTASFSETFHNAGGYQDDQPVHLCSYITESDASTPELGTVVTAKSDNAVPPRVRNYGLRINGGGYFLKKQYHQTVLGQCQDFWPNGKHYWTIGCPLAAKVVMTVSKRLKEKLGLSSRLLGSVKLVPYTGSVERTELALTAAGQKAMSHWKDSYVATLKATSTSPLAMTRTKTLDATSLWAFNSWQTSTNDSGGD